MTKYFGLLGLGFLLSLFIWWQWPDDKLQIVACDVGQGDAMLVQKGFTQVLIDGGPPEGNVISCLGKYMPFWDKHIELVVMTHPESDHMAGLLEILQGFKVGNFVTSGAVNDSDQYLSLWKIVSQEHVPVLMVNQGDTLRLGEIEFSVLWPEKGDISKSVLNNDYTKIDQIQARTLVETMLSNQTRELNKTSVVMIMRYKNVSGLLTGDIDDEVELSLLSSRLIEDVDVLKVAHHGSKTSTSSYLLEKSKPEIAIISVGKDNHFGHPHVQVLQLLQDNMVQILRTDESGDVILWTDGETLYRSM